MAFCPWILAQEAALPYGTRTRSGLLKNPHFINNAGVL